MHRRQFLRAVAGSSGLAAVAAHSARDAGGHSTASGGTNTSTATSSGTPTPTPTEAVATPTSEYEPLGSVAIDGVREAVVTPDGETAFVATVDGFATVDITDPADPAVLAEERDISPPGTSEVVEGVQDVKHDDGRLLVAGPANRGSDGFHGILLYDVSDPAEPELLRAHATAYPIHNCDLSGGYAYLTGNNRDDNPLVVVDVGGENPEEVARWSLFDHDGVWESVPVGLRSLHDVFVQNERAYLAHWDAGTWILDVSEPADPQYVADVRGRSPEELADLSGLAVSRERLEPPGNDHYAATDPDGSLLAVGKETWNSNFGKDGTTPGPDDPGGPSGIDLYDLSDPSAPAHLATIDPPPTADTNVNGVWTTAHNFEIAADHLYSSWYRGGVMVHDLSDPANPERVRYFRRSLDTSFWTAQLAAPGEAVVASSYEDPSDPDAPGRLYTFPDVPRATPTATESPTDGSSNAPTPTGTSDGTPTGAGGDETGGTTSGDGPGFGPVAALAALGLGAWRSLGGRERGNSEDRR
ncbi:LVIVD repeat-containing protein [Halosimplex salinum]|uniref:LVIVD repeat-containing protein n=1 Tax=Halosimplex salinum TaxID=1710538 RepID=UPI000F47CA7E|nr:hypothetical protein [Halosimplex salinum]